MYDVMFVNGTCPDFNNEKMKKMNIAVKDGKIVYTGNDIPEAERIIDASGLIVSPGFIDIHMHEEDFVHEKEEYCISRMMLEMGVTTAVGGNCGNLRQSLRDFKKILKRKGGSPVNYAMLAGYNSCRAKYGVGRYETPDKEQKQKIYAELKEEFEEGAFGLSFGIEYDPAITYEEILEAIHNVSNDSNHIISMHYRGDGPRSIASVDEMIRIAAQISQKFQISHLSSCSAMGTMKEVLHMINIAMEQNPRLNYDTYPYDAFSTRIGSAVFDEGCFENWGKTYSDILLTEEPYKNVYCTEEIFRDARENYPLLLAVAFVMREPEIVAAIVNEKGMIASDGLIRNGGGHPRAAGTFPRVLGKYVREEKVISMYDALKKMTVLPAERMGFSKKGRLELGCDADITVFDPETISDGATFTELKAPKGIVSVMIGGEIVLENGSVLNDRKGTFISYDSI
ncbi:amidohydrolase family protein [Anaerovoracaceae bacterium 42-11]